MKLSLSWKFLLLINVAGIALAGACIATLNEVDFLVHSTLYDYGLQFSDEWAIPYWTFLRLSIGLLGGLIAVGFFSTVYTITSRRTPSPTPTLSSKRMNGLRSTHRPASGRESEPEPRREPLQEVSRPALQVREKPTPADKSGVEILGIPMVCNKCGKVFTQPLCMFDFKSGKPRLVNVCPYCNTVLAVTGNSRNE